MNKLTTAGWIFAAFSPIVRGVSGSGMGETSGIFHLQRLSKKWLVGLGIAAAVAVVLGAYLIFFHKRQAPTKQPYNADRDQITRLEGQSAPSQAADRLSYYSQLAQHYDNLHDNERALANYLTAQAAADEAGEQVVFYMPIAKLYAAKGERAKSVEYYQKEIVYLRKFKKDHPETEEGTNRAIHEVEETIQKL